MIPSLTLENNGRIIELLAEVVQRQDRLIEETVLMKNDISVMKADLSNVELEISNVKQEAVKLNLQTTENTRAIFKLADKVEEIAELHKRVTLLEKEVFK